MVRTLERRGFSQVDILQSEIDLFFTWTDNPKIYKMNEISVGEKLS